MRSLLLAVSVFTLFLAPSLAHAVSVPVTLQLTSGSDGKFNFSFLHAATRGCEVISGIEFCKNGDKDAISGTLNALRDGQVLSMISGTISVSGGGGDITVTDGTIDFGSSAADTFGGSLVTSTHGTFYFLDHSFAGPANSFVGDEVYLWGNNWNTGNPGVGTGPGSVRWGLDLGIVIRNKVIPEPATALLLLPGLALLVRRRGQGAH